MGNAEFPAKRCKPRFWTGKGHAQVCELHYNPGLIPGIILLGWDVFLAKDSHAPPPPPPFSRLNTEMYRY